ncbi:hypothetical protein C7212DRAFT_347656 [Tuber magnatum]|uniref:Uncharacterized protein n=1 Tax=Tuber magnatum TaxID=42249 RepID=A0A317SEI5_9PEZI|nr:hypothetical protein C7212DRAFT_347656 [Tuber magnatum]
MELGESKKLDGVVGAGSNVLISLGLVRRHRLETACQSNNRLVDMVIAAYPLFSALSLHDPTTRQAAAPCTIGKAPNSELLGRSPFGTQNMFWRHHQLPEGVSRASEHATEELTEERTGGLRLNQKDVRSVSAIDGSTKPYSFLGKPLRTYCSSCQECLTVTTGAELMAFLQNCPVFRIQERETHVEWISGVKQHLMSRGKEIRPWGAFVQKLTVPPRAQTGLAMRLDESIVVAPGDVSAPPLQKRASSIGVAVR